MNHDLPEFGYIVAFLAAFLAVMLISITLARLTGYREK